MLDSTFDNKLKPYFKDKVIMKLQIKMEVLFKWVKIIINAFNLNLNLN